MVTLVFSSLDYCNSLLAGASQGQLRRLQRLQNVAARIVARPPKMTRIAPILQRLHWLPVHHRIAHKILCTVYKCISREAPEYLRDLLEEYRPSLNLRSATKGLLTIPKARLRGYGDRSFSVIGPTLWNRENETVRKSPSLKIFKRQVKTRLFRT